MRTITTTDELDALPLGSLIKDRHGDNALKFSKTMWVYPETAGLGVNYIAKHYGPFTVLHEPGKQEQVTLMGGRKAGKTDALIESLLERGAQRGIHITVHHALPHRDEIAALICRHTGCDSSRCVLDYNAADAVLELIQGEPT